jgi:hypothetical protein
LTKSFIFSVRLFPGGGFDMNLWPRYHAEGWRDFSQGLTLT